MHHTLCGSSFSAGTWFAGPERFAPIPVWNTHRFCRLNTSHPALNGRHSNLDFDDFIFPFGTHSKPAAKKEDEDRKNGNRSMK